MLIIILAAGQGKGMKSDLPQVMLSASGREMILYVIETAAQLNPDKIAVVLGSGADKVKACIEKEAAKTHEIVFFHQAEQKGTAHAVLSTKKLLENYKEQVLILCGDMPNMSAPVLKRFVLEANKKTVSFVSSVFQNPEGYGRVVRTARQDVLKIAEEYDANLSEKKIKEISTGIFIAEAGLLLSRLERLDNNNKKGEYRLSDIVLEGANAWAAQNEREFFGANNRIQLAEVSKDIWKNRAKKFMEEGVDIIDPENVYISHLADIGQDVTLYPNVYIEGKTTIAKGSILRHGVRIANSSIGENCEIRENTLIEESIVENDCKVGPMAHLRPGSRLAGKNSIGNFVELKKTELGLNSKANHLTYLGDCTVGKGVNIGCGTITCNYDGFNKHQTLIGDEVFVGSDVQFVAPVSVGNGALIGAGSTITKDVPADALAISRIAQQNLEGKAAEYRERADK